jgi:hypothetical protein
MHRQHRRRWFVVMIASAVTFGLVGGANGAPGHRGGELDSILYFGPAGASAGRHVSVAVTNATAATGKVTVAIVDQDGVLLKRRQSEIAPGRSAFWSLPEVEDEVLLFARATVPGGDPLKWPAALRITDAGGANPLVTETSFPALSTAASPLLPVPPGAEVRVNVTPLGAQPATFTVRLLGPAGGVLSQGAISGVSRPSIGSASFMPASPGDIRVVVKGPTGARFLVSAEVLDAATGSFICKWEGPDLDA